MNDRFLVFELEA